MTLIQATLYPLDEKYGMRNQFIGEPEETRLKLQYLYKAGADPTVCTGTGEYRDITLLMWMITDTYDNEYDSDSSDDDDNGSDVSMWDMGDQRFDDDDMYDPRLGFRMLNGLYGDSDEVTDSGDEYSDGSGGDDATDDADEADDVQHPLPAPPPPPHPLTPEQDYQSQYNGTVIGGGAEDMDTGNDEEVAIDPHDEDPRYYTPYVFRPYPNNYSDSECSIFIGDILESILARPVKHHVRKRKRDD
jgi:hypothetical protein